MKKPPTKPLMLTLLSPGSTADQRRQAAIEMHKAVHGTEPTDEELMKLEEVADIYRDANVDSIAPDAK